MNFRNQSIIALFLVLLLEVNSMLSAQVRPVFKRISVKDGLSNVAIKDIFEDDKGVMWFCTEDGLNRYDSYEFTIYRYMRGDTNSLGENYVNAIIQDKNGIFWIGTRSRGMVSFDPGLEQFTSYNHDPSDISSLGDDQVLCLAEDDEGKIWVGTFMNGISIYDPQDSAFRTYKPYSLNNPSDNTVVDIEIGEEGKVWVLTNRGLNLFDTKRNQFIPLPPPSFELALEQNGLYEVNIDLSGNIWYGSNIGAIKYDPIAQTYDVINPLVDLDMTDREGIILEILQTADSTYWIGTDNGLIRYREKENKFERINTSPYIKESFQEEPINKMFVDKHGLLWIGTQHFGVVKANLRLPDFIHYGTESTSPVVLPHPVIRSLLYDNEGNIWVGSVTGDLTRVFKGGESITEKIAQNSVSTLYQDKAGKYWIGTWGYGLYNLESSRSRDLQKVNFSDVNVQPNDIIQVIKEDKFGNFWIGTEYCLNLYNPQTNRVRRFLTEPGNLTGPFNSVQSNSIDIDVYGNIWVGTFKGLFKLIPNDPNINSLDAQYAVKLYDKELRDNRVTSINYEPNFPNQLVAGTFADGLKIITFQPDDYNIKVESYTVNDGLCSNVIYGVQRDLKDNIWMSTHYGLSQFDIITREFSNYYASDGLQDNQFFWGAMAKGSKENLLFGGIDGFNLIKANTLARDTTVAQVMLTGLRLYNDPIRVGQKINGREILPKQISYLDRLVLPHYQDMFTVEFHSPHHVVPEFNKYAYRVIGFRDDWIYTDSDKSFVTLTNLDPGEYILEVKSSNYQGVWNEVPTRLEIIIETPWWSTTLFRIIAILALAMAIIGIIRWRIRYLEASKRRLSALVNEKTREIKSQHREILEKNESLRSLNLKLKNNLDEKQEVIEKLEQTQDQLIESEKMASIGVLTAGLAHELNNPLSYIGGVVEPIKLDIAEIKPSLSKEILEKHKEAFDEIDTLLEGMSFGVVKAAEIIKNLLEISPKGNLEERTDFNMTEMIQATAKLIDNANKEVEINTFVDEPIMVNGNKVELNQVLINIIKNACDAIPTDRPGKVDIFSYSENGHVIIEIADNGTGISKEVVNQIFEPFFTTKVSGKGTGLGLYISYSVIKKHHGNINVESYPGAGTKFILTIPRNKAEEK